MNLNHGQRDVRVFRIASRYRFVDGKPVELGFSPFGATGAARAQGLYDPAREYSFADLKGDLDSIGAPSGGFRWEQSGPDWLNPAKRGALFLGKESSQSFNMGDFQACGGQTEIPPGRVSRRNRAWPGLLHVLRREKQSPLRAVATFPCRQRDFSLFLADDVTFADVTKTINSLNIAEIDSIEAADLFRGKNVPAGKYSLLVRVLFQSREATYNRRSDRRVLESHR